MEISYFELPIINWNALATIATLLMTVATFLTLYQNRLQLNELKRQWKDIHDPKLVFSIVSSEGMFHLKIKNIGQSVAFNVRLEICDSFIDKLLFKGIKDMLKSLNSNCFVLLPTEERYYMLSPIYDQGEHTIFGERISIQEVNENIDKIKFEPIVITGNYSDSFSISEEFVIDNFISDSITVSDKVVAQLKIMNTIFKECASKKNERCSTLE